MNCPYCGNSIGGYVEMGSTAYTRVANGCCPHCGRKLSGNYSAGFAQSTKPRKVSSEEYERETADNGAFGLFMLAGCVLAGVSFIVGVFPSKPWLAFIVGKLYIIITALVAIGSYFYQPMGNFNTYSGTFEHTENDIAGSGAFIVSLLIDMGLTFIFLFCPVKGTVYHGIALALCIAMFIIGLKKA